MPKGPQGQKRPADLNQLAKRIVDIATGEVEEDVPTPHQARASKGGKIGGNARAGSLTPEKRQEIARKAAESRWSRK
jgi:hypothetical protein